MKLTNIKISTKDGVILLNDYITDDYSSYDFHDLYKLFMVYGGEYDITIKHFIEVTENNAGC